MSENAIITAASVIGAGLVCLGAAAGAGIGNGTCAANLLNPWLVNRKNLVKSLPTCWFA